ncbi:methylated-DNA--[protein]-cysteine S-methyltransferase [Streptomyces sp. RS10V-4]|uniref:methylated-DNA--[protein]-cysteine S-methyltransferase n=1 Tax=Streptomyces rhizoryzae TaxID=2932493 RepID=UPI002002F500|nr:methylated-DNA--[protein]-cysteine S-methyltransferase [Streptomyces rhizoryzae]MCK7624525.1 methylated-DNA--[protein]-cysteine S-methyltransferase [Streptomyces rhizoryzae]
MPVHSTPPSLPGTPIPPAAPSAPATTYTTTLDSPLGALRLVGVESPTAPGGLALTSLAIPGQRRAPLAEADWICDARPFAEALRQLRAYFGGRLTRFELAMRTRGTAFQERVWQALDAIPYGTTTTYGRLADTPGLRGAGLRALGAALGANPLLLVRPCHRVIGADGTMRGYAAGVERKIALLTHEGALQPTLL